MTAPAPAPTPPAAPPAPRSRLTPSRLLAAVAFAAVGFVAVWQGFGLAGYGTDLHTRRVFVAVAVLFAAAMPLVWPNTRPAVRVLAGLIGLAGASYAWWELPDSNFKSARSLREAVAERDHYRGLLATATVEDVEPSEGMRGVNLLADQYPSLMKEVAEDYARWKVRMTDEIVKRLDRTPLDDYKTFAALRASTKALAEVHPEGANRIETTLDLWRADALKATIRELVDLQFGDWGGFDRTAPRRQTFADAFPESRDALVRTEAEWVDAATERTVGDNLTPRPGEPPARRAVWAQAHAEILALNSLDTADGRFAKARTRLFVVAHRAAQTEVAEHLEAGRYDRAFGVARAHAVEWNATAAVLGADELKKLDALRETCEALDKLAAKAAKPADPAEVAPPPRTKPEQ